MNRFLTFLLAGPLLLAAPAPVQAQRLDGRDRQICLEECIGRTRGPGDPRYRACVAQRCDGQQVRRQTTPRRTAEPAPAPAALPAFGTWTWGVHPALGASAHVQMPQGVFGIGCTPDGQGIALRVTNGLFTGPGLTVMYNNSGRALGIPIAPGSVWSQAAGNACQVGWSELTSASSLVLIPGLPDGVEDTAAGPQVVIAHPAGRTPVASGADAAVRLQAIVVPLATAAGPLAQFLSSCPAVQAAVAQPCP